MIRKIVYGTIIVVIAILGEALLLELLTPLLADMATYMFYLIMIGIALVLFLLCFFAIPPLLRSCERLLEKGAASVAQMGTLQIVCTALGLIAGLVIASLIGIAVARISIIGTYLAILVIVVFGYLGLLIGYRKRDDFAALFNRRETAEKPAKSKKKDTRRWQAAPKILDTSVIIDGRIADIYRTGFLEGDLVVAQFVLDELRHIADSGDSLKRNRGRSGLDCLNGMRSEFVGSIIIGEQDYPDIAEVDSKLLRLAQDMQGVVVTNDFNLNKVASLQGMRVLNINELSNAVKPVVLPGEEMAAHIVKEGKEVGQGVAYLDDGTMIVVENGRRFMGKHLLVIVTSILQTSAGRMIFARPKFDADGAIIEVD